MGALKNWEYFLVKTFDEDLLQKYVCINVLFLLSFSIGGGGWANTGNKPGTNIGTNNKGYGTNTK